MTGRKDVVMVLAGGGVRFITRFETFHDEMHPYMYHCHSHAPHRPGALSASTAACLSRRMIEIRNLRKAFNGKDVLRGLFGFPAVCASATKLHICLIAHH